MKATITIQDCDDGTLNVGVEFEPKMDDSSGAHVMALAALGYMASGGDAATAREMIASGEETKQ